MDSTMTATTASLPTDEVKTGQRGGGGGGAGWGWVGTHEGRGVRHEVLERGEGWGRWGRQDAGQGRAGGGPGQGCFLQNWDNLAWAPQHPQPLTVVVAGVGQVRLQALDGALALHRRLAAEAQEREHGEAACAAAEEAAAQHW